MPVSWGKVPTLTSASAIRSCGGLINSKCLSWGKIILSAWLRGPEDPYPKYEEAGCTLQVQVRAPLRPAPTGNANLGRITRECSTRFPME